MAAAAVDFGWSTDLAQARAAADLYADPADRAAAEDNAAHLAVNLTLAAGANPGAPAPGCGAQAQVLAARVQALDARDVLVSLLVRLTLYPGNGATPSTRLTSLKALVTWVDAAGGGDWRYRLTPVGDPPAPTAPGTAAFNIAGWSALTTPGGPR